MNKLIVLILCLPIMDIFKQVSANLNIVDKGDHVLECSQAPIDFGIVLDSSVSIAEVDFQKAKEFLVAFLGAFDIGNERSDVRVSIITFGKGIYTQDAFNLDTYPDKAEVLQAIEQIPHRAGTRTDTGLAIRYMHDHQLATSLTRSYAERICLVITDGNSQSENTTKREAARARDDGITMFALGVGDVSQKELLNIAGTMDRVTRVSNFDNLSTIKEILANKTCIRKEKPTTTPLPMTQSCGEANPADIEFIFSPSDLGLDATAWTTSFISNTLHADDMKVGFRYGASTDSCPMDEGFNLDTFTTVDEIQERLAYYDAMKLPSLIKDDLFHASRGGREHARSIAVVFSSGGKGAYEMEHKIEQLLTQGVKVFVANPAGYPVRIPGTTALYGRSSRQQSEALISLLCTE